VEDNGPGLPVETLTGSLDYTQRVSTNTYYVSPTRGQLGNALKTVWAAPFVATGGQRGRVEVLASGQRHTVDVTLDRIAQAPRLRLTSEPDTRVTSGTLVRLHWPGIASLLAGGGGAGFYKSFGVAGVTTLLRAYALCNPHAAFVLEGPGDRAWSAAATDAGWKKWLPKEPTSPHWYSADQLRALIAAYVTKDRETGRVRTVRELVAEFAGLSGSAKQKAIAEATGLGRARLTDLLEPGGADVALAPVEGLLAAMRNASRPVKPAALGVIGEAHLTGRLTTDYGVVPGSVKYKKVLGDQGGRPFVLEVAFGMLTDALTRQQFGRTVVAGINWAPALELPFEQLPFLLGHARADAADPVVVVAHLALPGVAFTDRGKGRADV
jgi:DNA topoisomerase VI subunit B